MFQPLCTNAISGEEAREYFEDSLVRGAFAVITDSKDSVRFEIRFKIAELFGSIMEK